MGAILKALRHSIGRGRRRLEAIPPPAWRGLPDRRLQAFGLGTPKSGTMSLSGIFDDQYRAGHEMEWGPTIDLFAAHRRGTINEVGLRRELARRDRRLHLEFEASCFITLCPGLLVKEFPDSRFVLTIRDCRGWLDSILDNNMIYRRSHDRYTARWHDLLFEPHRFSYTKHDAPLAERGLYPLDAYLNYWAASNRRVIDEVPSDRLLIVRMAEIPSRLDDLAGFFGIAPGSLDLNGSHLNMTPRRLGILAMLDDDYINARIESLDVGERLQRYWKC
jgi:hypothetical protein